MILRLILIFTILITYLTPSIGQTPKSFNTDQTAFLTEMEAFLAVTNKKDAEKLLEKFKPVWDGRLTGSQRDRIISTSNAMLKKRLKAYPDFSNYLNALIGFAEGGHTQQSFDNWHSGIDKLLTGSSRNFSSYLEVCYDLFASNTLYASTSTVWRSSNNRYTFEFDSLPKIVFEMMNLTCYSKGDSGIIYNTSGVYYPNLRKFMGKGGKVTWARAGLPENDVYAELTNYAIDVAGSDYLADQVIFYNKQLFKEPLSGRLTDKLLANVTTETAAYPRFNSNDLNLEIRELVKDASYRGGFSMHGSKIIGSGTVNSPASLTFQRNNIPFLVARSRSFVIRTDRIVTDNASVTFYFDKDSMYHPSLELKYINQSRELTLLRPTGKTTGTPYYDSFHDIDMYFDALVWKIDDPLINLKMMTGGGEAKLIFESSNYFREHRYQQLQAMAEVNPLYTLKQYAEKYQVREVSVSDYSTYLRMNDTQTRGFFLELNSKGFIAYDEKTDVAVIKDKLYFYIAASVGKSDYDILEFGSQISGLPNATINLLNYDINMRGVARVSVSDTQQVYVVPYEQELTLQKGRNFSFNGRVRAGRFDFMGKEFTFNYDEFKFHLKTIDSLSFRVPGTEPDESGRVPLLRVNSVLQNLTGYLSVDRPDNKSSYKKSPEYPIFRSDDHSFVYYDYPSIFNGIYQRDRFYFKVDPFTIDSLDNFNPMGMVFDGLFVSAGIFPDMREQLTIQRDYSLGFMKVLGNEGLSAYAGKGQYYEKLALNNTGLRGGGRINYLAADLLSKDFIFFPDSTNADVDDFTMVRKVIAGVEFPSAKAKDVYMNWRPYEDKMYLFKKNLGFALYDGKVDHFGNLVLGKEGLYGDGVLTFEQAQLISRRVDYKGITFSADTSDFSLRAPGETVPALATTNMKSFIDLEKRFGEFASNGTGSFVTFPLNRYISYIDKFKWEMDEKSVTLGSPTQTGDGARFVSIHPSQDSLQWYSPYVVYNMNEYILDANKVKEIDVADARIVPGDGKVLIRRDADMKPLTEARVIANRDTRYHTINNANITITSRKNYGGTGDYEYVDQLKVKHLLKMTQIGVDTSLQTFAHGDIPESLNFMLSPNIQYRGRMTIHAPSPTPFFKGFARANHNCESIAVNWFSFAAEIDPSGVNIPVIEPVGERGDKLFSAIWLKSDSAGYYGSFISPNLNPADHELISAEGLLSFNNANREFKIVPLPEEKKKRSPRDKEKEGRPFNEFNSFVMNDDQCSFSASGKMNFGVKYGQFKVNALGKAMLDPNIDTLHFDMLAGLDFMFSNDALKLMADLMLSYPTLPAVNDNREIFKEMVPILLGAKESEKFFEEVGLYGNPKKTPDQLQNSIFFTDLKMYYDKTTNSYRSAGNLGVGYVGKYPVGRMLKGFMEVARKRSGDVFNLFLELDGNTWYYFNYQRGVMQVISSDPKFNESIENMKPEKRIADEKDGKAPYQYMTGSERKKVEFVKRMEGRE